MKYKSGKEQHQDKNIGGRGKRVKTSCITERLRVGKEGKKRSPLGGRGEGETHVGPSLANNKKGKKGKTVFALLQRFFNWVKVRGRRPDPLPRLRGGSGK